MKDDRVTSSLSRKVSTCIVSDDDEVEAFAIVTTEQELESGGQFFGSLHLSPNGGLYEVGELFSQMRYIGAAIFVAVLLINVQSVVKRAIAVITGETALEDGALAHEKVMLQLLPHDVLTPQVVVAWFELGCLAFFVLQILKDVLTMLCCSRCRNGTEEYKYWSSVSHLLKDIAPMLQSFSAMKVLQFVTPSLLNVDLMHLMRKLRSSPRKSGFSKLLSLATFFLTRLFMFAFGFEAFLIKFREVAHSLSQHDEDFTELRAVARLLIFLNQMIGVVQLNLFASDRLFRFIFGGVDNVIDPIEYRKMCVWKASLMKRIWSEFKSSPTKAFAVAVTFNDTDFQRLVLDDDGGEAEADAPGWYHVLHDGVWVTPSATPTGSVGARLGSGSRVKVLEVQRSDGDVLTRARIEEPAGWIALVNLKTGYRWASRETSGTKS